MTKILYKISKIILATSLIFIYSCNQEPAPTLFDYPVGGNPTPVINSIEPPGGALAGVSTLTIKGSNFSSDPSKNYIYFNGTKASVLSATSNELTVKAPKVIGDDVIVKLATYKSVNFSNTIIYKLEAAVSEYYPFDATSKFEFPFGIWVDNQENVYVSLQNQGIKTILPTTPTSLVNFAPKGPESFFRAITLASDNAIYAVRGGIRGVYRAVQNTAPVAFLSSANGITDNVNDVEFDATRNIIWGGGATGIIYNITLDKVVKKFNIQGVINAIRVAGNDLFVASRFNNEEIVWKVPIIRSDSLGTASQYFNVSTAINASITIKDIAISVDGDLYIGTDQNTDPIYVVHADKSFETLYPGLIEGQVYSLSWDYGDTMFMTNVIGGVNKTVLKIKMQKLGAH